jgi:seryl-tRNA synthetase
MEKDNFRGNRTTNNRRIVDELYGDEQYVYSDDSDDPDNNADDLEQEDALDELNEETNDQQNTSKKMKKTKKKITTVSIDEFEQKNNELKNDIKLLNDKTNNIFKSIVKITGTIKNLNTNEKKECVDSWENL